MKGRIISRRILHSSPFRVMIAGVVCLFAFLPAIHAGGPERNPGQPVPRLSGEVFRLTTQTIGSPFFYDNWSTGVVVLASGAVVDDHLLMYNGFTDELLYQHPLTYEIIVADKMLVREFRLINPGGEDVFQNIRNSRWSMFSGPGDYFRVLYEGKVSLLVHQKVKKAGEVSEYTEDGPLSRTKLEPDPAYYIFLDDGRSFLIRRFTRKTFFRIFPEQAGKIREAFRQNHIRLRNEPDFIEAVRIIDENL